MGDQYYKQSLSLADIEMFNNFSGLNSIHHHHHHHEGDNLMGLWHDHNNVLCQENLPAFLIQDQSMTQSTDHDHKDKKRKATVVVNTTPTTSAYSSPQVSDNGSKKTNRGKKAKSNEKQEEKAGDVIHVRAKRGQATDSHSLAERVRRGKINERLRCLQDIVPGCYKTMGMAVMLDEIINYVQSLQNQVEFLSMKLTAATTFNDFNCDTDAMVHAMQRAKAFEALKIENDVMGANQEFSPLMPLNFGPNQHQNPFFLT